MYPYPLDASTGFALPVLENQFLIGLLDQGLEELALDFETGLMDVRLDLVGEMLFLLRYGRGDPQCQFECERLAVRLDGAEGKGSLKTVGGTHGVSPYWHDGGSSCVLSYQSSKRSHRPAAGISPENSPPILCILPSIAHQLARARGNPNTSGRRSLNRSMEPCIVGIGL